MKGEIMTAQTAKRCLGLAFFSLLILGAIVPAARAASPTLIASCPYTITTSGSYAVTGDLTAMGTGAVAICVGICLARSPVG